MISGNEVQKVIFVSFCGERESSEADPSRLFLHAVTTRLEQAGYFVLTRNTFVGSSSLKGILALADLVVCLWDQYFAESSWKIAETEVSLQSQRRAVDPIRKNGERAIPLILCRLDDTRAREFSESYNGQIVLQEKPDSDVVFQDVARLIGTNGNDELPYLNG